MRVLVIEDEPRLAATLQDLLELEGYTAGAGYLIPEKRAKECWYRFSMALRKNGGG